MDKYDKNILVTVICTAYNQEKYIRQCLDGFVSQHTDFKFEVLVHDDASTDGTVNIIQEYEKKYPDIIRPYYQKKNTYSRNIPSLKLFLSPMSRGKYIAFCEGDDYWCDPHKLQKQVEIMEAHPEYHFCAHRVRVVNEDGSYMGTFYPLVQMASQVVSPNLLVEHSLLTCRFQTSSYFTRASDFWPFIQNPPLFQQVAPVGDTPLMLYCATLGDSYYLDDTMSCYRNNANGSWTIRMKNSKKLKIKMNEDFILFLQEYNRYTKYRFQNYVNKAIINWQFGLDILNENWLACLSSKYKDLLRRESIRGRISIRLRACFQWLMQVINKVQR